jgi:hypothetical protein
MVGEANCLAGTRLPARMPHRLYRRLSGRLLGCEISHDGATTALGLETMDS